jgi:hypothetical protein
MMAISSTYNEEDELSSVESVDDQVNLAEVAGSEVIDLLIHQISKAG